MFHTASPSLEQSRFPPLLGPTRLRDLVEPRGTIVLRLEEALLPGEATQRPPGQFVTRCDEEAAVLAETEVVHPGLRQVQGFPRLLLVLDVPYLLSLLRWTKTAFSTINLLLYLHFHSVVVLS